MGNDNGKMIAYKTAINPLENTRALVVLEIPADGKNNIQRTNIYDPNYARYRCDRAKVISIQDMETGEELEGATSMFGIGGKNKILYLKGETVVSDGYEKDPHVIFGSGIHFFLSEEPARHLRMNKPTDGLYKDWYDDGRISMESFYKDGVLHGEYKSWHANGMSEHRGIYTHGLKHGTFETWFDSGNLKSHYNYVKDHLHGECIEYYPNGYMQKLSAYNMQVLNGTQYEWYYTGKPSTTTNYKNGYKQGEYRSYHSNGFPMEESYFMFDKLHGERKLYDDAGKLISHRCYRNGFVCC